MSGGRARPGDVVVVQRRLTLWAARAGAADGSQRARAAMVDEALLVVAVAGPDVLVVCARGGLGWTTQGAFAAFMDVGPWLQ